jgi:hypothetical protein
MEIDMSTFTTSVPFPPFSSTVIPTASSLTSGTINHVACGGAMDCTITDAAGNLLIAVKTNVPSNFPVNLPFSGGSPVITQRTPSDITVNF